MLLLFPVLVLIRGGNDAYMLVTPEDITMTRAAYAETPPGSKVVALDVPTGLDADDGIDEARAGTTMARDSEQASPGDRTTGTSSSVYALVAQLGFRRARAEARQDPVPR